MGTEVSTAYPCKVHSPAPCLGYCTDCKLFLCKVCASTSSHFGHNIVTRVPKIDLARVSALIGRLRELKVKPGTERALHIYIETFNLVLQAGKALSEPRQLGIVAELLIKSTVLARSLSTAIGSIQERISLWTDEDLGWMVQKAESFVRLELALARLPTDRCNVTAAHCLLPDTATLSLFDGKTRAMKYVKTELPMGKMSRFDTIQVGKDRILVASQGSTEVPGTLYIDAGTGKVTPLADSINRKENPALANFMDRYVVSVGGILGGHTHKCEVYDALNNKWSVFPSLLHGLDWISTLVFNARFLYSIGGCDGSGGSSHIQVIDMLDQEDGWCKVKYREQGDKFYAADSGTVQDSNISGLIFGSSPLPKVNFRYFFYGDGLLALKPGFPIERHFRQRKGVVVKGWAYEFTFSGGHLAQKCLLSDRPWSYLDQNQAEVDRRMKK